MLISDYSNRTASHCLYGSFVAVTNRYTVNITTQHSRAENNMIFNSDLQRFNNFAAITLLLFYL